ncbi:MAG: hypothetical protein IME98_00715 [Proteobacteria bacterium]|nr:hypothetical protein [Pseudomonadota bacterium]
MRIRERVVIFAVAVAVFLLSPAVGFAERGVINEASVGELDGCAVVVVRFNFPVRYIRHFPKEQGSEVRIQFEPLSINLADLENRFEREEVRFSPDDRIPLSEIIFEGNITGGPFLTLTFLRSLAFEVKQGADYRSIVVTPFQDVERVECFPAD